jgi:hypothetical protein
LCASKGGEGNRSYGLGRCHAGREAGLAGRGIGYIDAHLLAAVFLEGGATLRTRNKRLSEVAKGLLVAYAG